jgi:hypothetical protein
MIHTTMLDLPETNLSLVVANHTQHQWEVLAQTASHRQSVIDTAAESRS